MILSLVPMATLMIAAPLGVERLDPRRALGLALGAGREPPGGTVEGVATARALVGRELIWSDVLVTTDARHEVKLLLAIAQALRLNGTTWSHSFWVKIHQDSIVAT